MIMTEEQVCREYREAKHPSRHIGVLADMNLCKRSEIIDILVANGLMEKPKEPEPKKITTKKPIKTQPKAEAKTAEFPPEVCAALEKAMSEIEKEIKTLEERYKVIAGFLWNGGKANG